MSSIRSWLFGAALAAASAVSVSAHAQGAPDGANVYETRCKACHDGGNPRAPSRADLAQRAPADIVTALTSGIMQPMAQGLSDADKQAVAAYLTSAPGGEASAGRTSRPTGTEMPQVAIKGGVVGTDPMCATNPPIHAGPSDWASMGVDDASTRFQRHPGLNPADVPKLKVKWAFSMTGGGQPAVVGDWLWVTNRSGKFYALDAKTGCVHWSVDDLVSRTTPMIIKSSIAPSGWATFVSQSDRIVRAFDAQTGKELWKSAQIETHPVSVLTGSPVVAGDRLIVPISSIEEAAAMSKAYSCCTFRGSVAALDLKTGKLLWKTPMIDGPMKTIRDKTTGGKVQGPAGAAVWAAPTLDKKRGLVYAVTGDSYTDIDTNGDDAIVALDLKTGAIKWRRQVSEHDNFVMGCGPRSESGNCPTPLGPDYDFGATPVLMTLHGGKQVLVAGQKSGIVYGLNPDTGALIWKTIVGAGSALGGVEWGIGADDSRVYVPISDLVYLFNPATASKGKAGVYALNPADGAIVWSAPAPVAPCVYASDKGKPSRCARAQPAAPAVIPGLVFEGGLDGWFRAYDAKTGKIVWEDSTTSRTYDTVNGIKGQPGGGIDGMGPTVADGMVFITSGNNGAARVGSNGVNVLLAYSVDGK
ncbi:MAG TPA: PQQ-binding-like beta-propeller repeat protein [Phenylobacterium sp.]|uniref:outer membrane protein assembly factor BamB family protein n=1 Tax=Phenylobacterium sp. TaxID=1871053 RepID=UPI002D70AE30|nr:PQQ-binding-like beta-propeller repeat protein [Phenylobacterium sp.]HZZ68821.1 PQQ-binding-like beta-propeller repeat protein [Phenylobacterium sp.]